MEEPVRLSTPLSDEAVEKLRAGDRVLISGYVYTARDAAHKRLVELVNKGEPLPFDISGQVIYYVGPTPPKPGMPIGSAGPTTSYRMDPYAPVLMEKGLKGMIGKGARGSEVREAMKRYRAVYFAGTGGAGALLSRTIKEAVVVAYEDLGTEAVRRLLIEDFPAVVINDIYGNDLYKKGKEAYRRA
ncbi:MAG: Fe-S-containing hydro-lyase [Deltaproteobacteria bacterium]|nr:Fe-S-containing hydro-lyase [Deltaproteobacteria bacterium]